MAKGSQFWGNASGKLGEQVLYRSGGEQRARTYVKKIKNPKTIAQMRGRIVMGNLVAVFNSLRPIVRNSFTNRESNQSGWNAFVKANKNAQTPIIDPSFNGTGISVPYEMVISKGNVIVPALEKRTVGEDVVYGIPFTLPAVDWANTGSLNATNFAEMLSVLGLPTNTKMTIVVAQWADEGFRIKHVTADVNTLAILGGYDLNLILEMYESFGTAFFGISAEDSGCMLAVIFSYTDGNGALQTSRAKMTLLSDDLLYVQDYIPGGEIYERVLSNSIVTQEDVLATK